MALETDLNVSPYFDDYNESKDFYKILFRPGVAVQARELNQFQTILQKQVERFGDNIFKRGTIIDGCNFNFYPNYEYVKLVDNQKDGQPVDPSTYVGYFAKSVNTALGVKSFITNYQDGFESTDPDLKTIYLNYLNAGANGTTNTFIAGEIIQIYTPQYPLFAVGITTGGTGFSNSDTVVAVSSIIVNTTPGTFSVGNILVQGSAKVEVVSVDTTTLATSNQAILKVKPRTVDLSDATVNASAWAITNAVSIANAAISTTVEGIIGYGMSALLSTDSSGKIIDFTVVDTGSGYSSLPHVTVKSTTGTIDSLVLSPRNYIANVQISTSANSVGNGYAFGVSEGIVYQKGFFSRVEPQTIIVEKFSQLPDKKVVGFDTAEQIIDSNIDTSLLDNATGTENENAPGANRLKLTPELIVMSSNAAAANDNFFVLTEWVEGRPFKQNQSTAYNKINDEMARRTSDESGDYVINRFQVTTRSPANNQNEGRTFSVVVDPGTAYIDGYRVDTKANYVVDIPKGNDVELVNNHSISLDYGNFIRINEVGGLFQFNTGDSVKLYSSAKTFASNSAAATTGNTTPVGSQIGTANMRSMMYFDGIPGTANAIYKLYLFNIQMNSGKNFRDVKSVYYDGTSERGIADLVLTPNPTLNANIAVLEQTSTEKLLFPSGVYSLKSSNNNSYMYRTIFQNQAVSNATAISTTTIATDFFPYSGNLSDADRRNVYIIPTSNGMTASANGAGSVSVTATSPNVTGTSTAFTSEYQVGDYVWIANTGSNTANRILNIVNNTFMILTSNSSITNTSAKSYRYFPKNVPISLSDRGAGQTTHVINVDTVGQTLTIQFKHANGSIMRFDSSTATAANLAIAVNVERRNASPVTTTATRNAFVKIRTANNVAGNTGPWCIGVTDAFRLRAVYIDSSNSVSNTSTNVIDDFYIDHNQNANFYDLGFLYKKTDSNLKISSSDYLLVEFDYGSVSSTGFLNTQSYTHSADANVVANNDGKALSALTDIYNSFEVPEVYTKKGEFYDLLNTFDFRPRCVNTVTPSATVAVPLADYNPNNTLSFGNTADPANDKKFPVPQSVFKTNIEQYLGRIDSVFVDRDGAIFTAKGTPGASSKTTTPPKSPSFSMRLDNILISPYPNIPQNVSNTFAAILNRHIASERFSNTRMRERLIQETMTGSQIISEQPMGYSMKQIGNLDRRISDLEYYVSLTLLESNMKDRVIPSSLDPALARFKYGFFVDDFSSSRFSDVDNKSYAATIEFDDVVPQKEISSLPNEGTIIQNYIDYTLVSQLNATGNVATSNVVTVANTWSVRKEPSKKKGDIFNLSMSTISAPVTLFGHFYSGGDEVSIYQGNTLIKTATNAAVLTDADKTKLYSNAVPSSWFKGIIFKNFSLSGSKVKNSFKISWTHNPAAGLNYTIKVVNDSSVWRYAIEYPINSTTISTSNNSSTAPVIYNGVMTVSPEALSTRILN
jgi:hypothetical protein